jgi:hypothetical protein
MSHAGERWRPHLHIRSLRRVEHVGSTTFTRVPRHTWHQQFCGEGDGSSQASEKFYRLTHTRGSYRPNTPQDHPPPSGQPHLAGSMIMAGRCDTKHKHPLMYNVYDICMYVCLRRGETGNEVAGRVHQNKIPCKVSRHFNPRTEVNRIRACHVRPPGASLPSRVLPSSRF